jgi:Uma2 family endonuclease
MSTVSPISEQRVIIDGVRWSTYLALVEDGEHRRGRMAYDQGTLEIMSPGKTHENVGCLIGRMIEAFTEELAIEIVSVASTTFKREDVQRAFEADKAYYVTNANAVVSKTDLDLAVDPPPDLVVEVDISRSSLDKQPIFHSLGVPEVWRFANDVLTLLVRDETQYRETTRSSILARFPLEKAREVLSQRTSLGETALMRGFRTWVRENIPGGE